MEQESQMIQGTVLAVIYQNPENGYCVLKVRTEQGEAGHCRPLDAPPVVRAAV